ncbi:MAG: rhomboid family intramembrane serine protease [Polyangiaceae bacterium]
MIPPALPPVPPRSIGSPMPDEARLAPLGWLDEAPVTQALLWLNAAIFAMEAVLAHSVTILPQRIALELGASESLATVGEFRWETLVTACFLHDGLLHVGFNMLVLWQAGPLVERTVGSARMAPMYLAAGVCGNALSVAYRWFSHAGTLARVGFFDQPVSMGASGAIAGILAGAVVLGWRFEGWRGPMTQAMLRWVGINAVCGALSAWTGGHIDNAAHLGGALTGGLIALGWGRRAMAPPAAGIPLACCAAVLFASIAVVAVRDRTDRFAALTLQDRYDFTHEALADGRCADAEAGLMAVERLRAKMAPVRSLRSSVDEICGHSIDP